MGCFDTMHDGKHSIQVKCFFCSLSHYHTGDKVPKLHNYLKSYKPWDESEQIETYTIVMAPYGYPRFALIKKGIFVRFTQEPKETYPPYVARWGELISGEKAIKSDSLRTDEE